MKKSSALIVLLLVLGIATIVFQRYSYPRQTLAQNTGEPIQTAQEGDLVVCTLKNSSGYIIAHRFIFVERRNEQSIFGYEADTSTTKPTAKEIPFSAFARCHIKIHRKLTRA